MLNPFKRLVVYYPGIGFRIRSCQSTVFPPGENKFTFLSASRMQGYDEWMDYIHSHFGADSQQGDKLVAYCRLLVNKQSSLNNF